MHEEVPAYQVRDTFLKNEILAIEGSLPGELVGNGPVCLSVFQPTSSGGQLVLLDRGCGDRVRMARGLSAHKSFIDPDVGAVWGSVIKGPTTTAMVDYYIANNSPSIRGDVYRIYVQRFASKVEIQEEGHVSAGTWFQLCYVCPRPDYSNSSDCRHVPRFGVIYTFEKMRPKGLLTGDMSFAAERIFQIRLHTLLGYRGKFHPKSKINHPIRTEQMSIIKIGAALASGLTTTMDERIFLIAKLLLVHHFFFPHNAIVIQLFQMLSDIETSHLFNRHGLPAYAPELTSDKKLKELLNAVTQDMAYLVAACDPATLSSQGKQGRAEIVKKIEQSVLVALWLLCGECSRWTENGAEYITVHCPKGLRVSLDEEHPWPIFKMHQFETWVASPNAEDRAKSILESLHPEGPISSRRGERYNNMDVYQRKMDGRWIRHELSDWYISYARARCTCDSLDGTMSERSEPNIGVR
jgi:hypothetical protein